MLGLCVSQCVGKKELVINYSDTDVQVRELQENKLKAAYFDTENKTWIPVETELDMQYNTVKTKQTNLSGYWTILESETVTHTNEPDQILQSENNLKVYPNPSQGNVTILFSLPETENVTLSIYNLLGKEIKNIPANNLRTGENTITWNGTDNQNTPVEGGIYFIRFETSKQSETTSIVLIK